ncbi:hypothetical protein CUJ83_08235 [Methanocella sp. CWC-04]|uniref:Uncharacterized protein n=2 Tax=Methanooceanicella nereidis TaxID=2052831 RepID=A0AAP2RCY3_9EURY|nr:hypothetical protein [Methanocella sp. CWC-04]
MLENFSIGMIDQDNRGEMFNSDEREYYIEDYVFSNVRYRIHARETGSELMPSKIEAWFYINDKKVDPPQELIQKMKERDEEISDGRILLYVNGLLAHGRIY